jgi:hypothetical protein
MTEPKHIPLTARLAEYAGHWAEEFIEAMTKADDAHDFETDTDESN